MGRKMGLEPTTLGTTIRCSNRLSYKLHKCNKRCTCSKMSCKMRCKDNDFFMITQKKITKSNKLFFWRLRGCCLIAIQWSWGQRRPERG